MQNKLFYVLIVVLSVGLTNVSAQETVIKPTPKLINGGVINGKAVSLPKPEYPASAQAVRASGTVNVQVTIDEQGNIISASAVSGHPLLRQAAEQAARQAIFKPTLLSGQPVKVSGVIVYNFVPSKPVEEDAPIWAFGMFLSFLQVTDSALINELGDEKELSSVLADMANDIPAELSAEKPVFDKLAKAVGNERRALAGELLGAIKNRFGNDEKWQIEIGEHLGAVMSELIKQKKNIAGGAAAVNEVILKTNLLKISDSLLSAPPETSPELIKKFKNVANFADSPKLNSPEMLNNLLNTIEPLFGTFSDE